MEQCNENYISKYLEIVCKEANLPGNDNINVEFKNSYYSYVDNYDCTDKRYLLLIYKLYLPGINTTADIKYVCSGEPHVPNYIDRIYFYTKLSEEKTVSLELVNSDLYFLGSAVSLSPGFIYQFNGSEEQSDTIANFIMSLENILEKDVEKRNEESISAKNKELKDVLDIITISDNVEKEQEQKQELES